MKNLIKISALAILALACSDDDYQEEAAEYASTQQPLVIVQPSGGGTFWTIGYDAALNDRSRCSRNQGVTANCVFARPKPGATNVFYSVLLPTGGFVDSTGVSYNSAAFQELQFFATSYVSQVNGASGMDPWVMGTSQNVSGPNVVFDSGSISGTPGPGETRWEYFVKPSVIGGCRLLSESSGGYPGTYSACDMVKLTIDMNDLFAAHPTSQRQKNLSQAIEYGLHLALGISGKSTAGRRLEPGVLKTTFSLDSEEKAVLRQFKNGDDSGWGNPNVPPTWPATIAFSP